MSNLIQASARKDPPPKDPSSFANLLASFSAKKTDAMWDESALLDDVATFSYEQALHAPQRLPPAHLGSAKLTVFEVDPAAPSPQEQPHRPAARKRKTATITVHLTEAERDQLQARAGAADLSVSAYLRSCILEAESLRAQVKEALSQINAATKPEQQAREAPPQKPPSRWRSRFLPGWSRDRASA
jgi:hypothetical protein